MLIGRTLRRIWNWLFPPRCTLTPHEIIIATLRARYREMGVCENNAVLKRLQEKGKEDRI